MRAIGAGRCSESATGVLPWPSHLALVGLTRLFRVWPIFNRPKPDRPRLGRLPSHPAGGGALPGRPAPGDDFRPVGSPTLRLSCSPVSEGATPEETLSETIFGINPQSAWLVATVGAASVLLAGRSGFVDLPQVRWRALRAGEPTEGNGTPDDLDHAERPCAGKEAVGARQRAQPTAKPKTKRAPRRSSEYINIMNVSAATP